MTEGYRDKGCSSLAPRDNCEESLTLISRTCRPPSVGLCLLSHPCWPPPIPPQPSGIPLHSQPVLSGTFPSHYHPLNLHLKIRFQGTHLKQSSRSPDSCSSCSTHVPEFWTKYKWMMGERRICLTTRAFWEAPPIRLPQTSDWPVLGHMVVSSCKGSKFLKT